MPHWIRFVIEKWVTSEVSKICVAKSRNVFERKISNRHTHGSIVGIAHIWDRQKYCFRLESICGTSVGLMDLGGNRSCCWWWWRCYWLLLLDVYHKCVFCLVIISKLQSRLLRIHFDSKHDTKSRLFFITCKYILFASQFLHFTVHPVIHESNSSSWSSFWPTSSLNVKFIQIYPIHMSLMAHVNHCDGNANKTDNYINLNHFSFLPSLAFTFTIDTNWICTFIIT